MITTQQESFEENLEELKKILPLHYKELALDQDKVPLSPMYENYVEHERNGQLIFATMREDGELIGYFIGFVAPGLHYSTCLTCTMDIFYLHPEKRGAKLGKRLFEFVEKELKAWGVDRWIVGSKCHKDASWLFELLEFKRIEVFYSKWLGE